MSDSDAQPLSNLKFRVDLGGEVINFQEVVLPESEIEVIEYREGSDVLSSVRKLPGITKYSHLILRHGLTRSQYLYDWFKQTKQGNLEKRNVTVSILNEEKEPVAVWKLRNCWPTKYSSSTLNAQNSGVVIETLEIATEDVDLEIK